MTLTGKSLVAGVIGWPVTHSISPRLHGLWLQQSGIDGTVIPLAIEPENFAQCLTALPKMGLRGVWITLPHKEQALALADDADKAAHQIGAANTLLFRDGKIIASNTDGIGFTENLKAQQPDCKIEGRTIAVLGAGGAARAIIFSLLEENPAQIVLTNRTQDRAHALAQDFTKKRAPEPTPIRIEPWSDQPDWLPHADIVINTTSLGMDGQPPLAFSLDTLPKTSVVCDIVYKPLYTELLTEAKARGNPVVTGLGMLIHQGIPGFEMFFGTRPNITPDLQTLLLDQKSSVS